MRFDDSLDTVLAAEMASPAAVEWTWRQLVDLIGRRRSRAGAEAIERLQAIRDRVPFAARAAAARGLERADPPATLVALFVDDEIAVAAPVARSAQLTGPEWIALLPAMRPATRGILRLRRDLPEGVAAALAAFGPNDFALSGTVEAKAFAFVPDDPLAEAEPATFVPPEPSPFVDFGAVARELPVVAEAIRLGEAPATPAPARENFEIAAIVARIEAHRRAAEDQPPLPLAPPAPPAGFRFETDAAGAIRWVDGIVRGPLIGLSLNAGRDGAPASVDGVAAGALARRARFVDARLEVGGASEAAGSWRIAGVPVFDHASGRFTGYRATARRPRADEAPRTAGPTPATDALRQLVHELRTPANAISGFAEMIEHQLLGPVAPAYRDQAAAIRGQTAGLLDAIDDLDIAARLESQRLDLRSEAVVLAPLLARVCADLQPLAELRGATLSFEVAPDAVVTGDMRALDRLVSRFLAAVVASAGPGETITGQVAADGDTVSLTVARPAAFTASDGALFETDAEVEAAGAGGPLLGTGFGFRLARRLAGELGGSLQVGPASLTLRLPAAVDRVMGQATV